MESGIRTVRGQRASAGDDAQWGMLNYRDIQLTHAQIITLKTAPITLVDAPGSGLAIFPLFSYILVDARGGTYSGDADLNFKIGTEHMGDLPYLSTTGAGFKAYYGDISDEAPEKELITNTPLILKNDADTEWDGGHASNTVSIRIWWAIVPTDPFGA